MPDENYDRVVIGGGIVGLAVAREMLIRRPSDRVALLEKEAGLASHQTGRNSGVVHTGIFYRPGSLKARLCTEGRNKLVRFCAERGVPYATTGKLIIAATDRELPRLRAIASQGKANGVDDLEMLGPAGLQQHEPHAVGVGAIWSPSTGVVDFSMVADALAACIDDAGGEILRSCAALGFTLRGGGVVVETTAGSIAANQTVVCAGLQSDRVAGKLAEDAGLRIVPFRGDYYVLSPEASDLVRSMINPVPDPRFPFAGVHFTRQPDGRVLVGPNAVLAFSREEYGHWDVNLRDSWSTCSWPGFWRVALPNLRSGLTEFWTDNFKRWALRHVRRYVPEVGLDDLMPGTAGIRAQAVTRAGSLLDDFSFVRSGPVLHVMNAPSPAATSALAIAEVIVDQMDLARPAGP